VLRGRGGGGDGGCVVVGFVLFVGGLVDGFRGLAGLLALD
jgi:hypothetical protein